MGDVQKTTKSHQLQMRVDEYFLDLIDEWRGKQRPVPSRSEAIRTLCTRAINSERIRR